MPIRWNRSTLAAAIAFAGALFLSLSAALALGAASRPTPADHRLSPASTSKADKALTSYLRHDVGPLTLAGAQTSKDIQSVNWSGFVDTSKTKGAFSEVSATWSVPTVTCTPEDRMVSDWVGFDGVTDGTVEQTGSTSWCFEGAATYYTWYEMYPAGTAVVGTAVQPGDSISASLVRKGTTYTLSLTDSTTRGNDIHKTLTCSANFCLDKSADWITERPEFSDTGVAPLVDYGTTTFSDATVRSGSTKGVISTFSARPVTMLDSTDTYDLSTPSALNAAGNAFSTTWLDSY